MKNKYQRMNKEEKQNVIKKYKSTEKGQEMITRLNRLLIIGGIGIAISAYFFFEAISKTKGMWDYIYASMILIASVVFIIGSIRIRGKELNKQALKEK